MAGSNVRRQLEQRPALPNRSGEFGRDKYALVRRKSPDESLQPGIGAGSSGARMNFSLAGGRATTPASGEWTCPEAGGFLGPLTPAL